MENEQTLQQKIELYSDMLYRIAFLQMKNKADAEDIVQETFCQYLNHYAEFESEEHEKAWLIKVTLNSCRKIWRSAWFRHNREVTEYEFETSLSDKTQTEENYIKQEQGKEVLEAVLGLPEKYRQVIHLFYYEELSVREISHIVGQAENTVTSQLTRGRKILRNRLGEEYRFNEF